ncbi:MAG: hypothetical protein ABI699_03925 [Caldimonas sp.]
MGLRYLLVGGSNCVIGNGFGARLQKSVAADWLNQSLGNSSSLRGIDYLLGHPEVVAQVDAILFEYTLNDLIFEASNTLDPASHLSWLRVLASNRQIADKLVFILMHGQGPVARIGSGDSFVIDHYRRVAAEFGIGSVDLLPLLASSVKQLGLAGVFKDNDHFSETMVQRLAAQVVASLPTAHGPRPAHEPGLEVRCLVAVDPLTEGRMTEVEPGEFGTALLQVPTARLAKGSEIVISSPGGALVGFYGVSSRNAGIIRLTHRGRDIVKTMRHRFAMPKPYWVLRHLTSPLHTQPGEAITLRYVADVYAAPRANLDNTLAQVVNSGGGESVELGRILFLVGE